MLAGAFAVWFHGDCVCQGTDGRKGDEKAPFLKMFELFAILSLGVAVDGEQDFTASTIPEDSKARKEDGSWNLGYRGWGGSS